MSNITMWYLVEPNHLIQPLFCCYLQDNMALCLVDPNTLIRECLRGKYHCTIDLLFDWFGISCMTCFYLQNRLIETSQTGGQWSPFSIPWPSAWLKTYPNGTLVLFSGTLPPFLLLTVGRIPAWIETATWGAKSTSWSGASTSPTFWCRRHKTSSVVTDAPSK